MPFFPFGLNSENKPDKRVHPVPLCSTTQVNKTTNRTEKVVFGCAFDKMTFTQKKNLLMADEE
jgi:hypothetical protein